MKKGSSRAYNVWTEKEEDALRAGVRRYGIGAWELIRQDKDFPVLKKRSGVQLKDKWRNLVKFRKLNEEELRSLPARSSGPWSRRGGMRRPPALLAEEGVGDADSGSPTEETILHEEHCDSVEIGNGYDDSCKRRSERACMRGPRRFEEFFTDFEGEGPESRGQRRASRAARFQENRKILARLEDRRYGIYDIRRYSNHALSETRNSCNNDSETVTEDNLEEPYVVDCHCGVTYDDGKMMIECELCKAWAHIECLKARMVANFDLHQYDFNSYLCDKCQARSPMGHWSLTMSAKAPDQGSSISDEDVWHPLAGFDVPKRRRLPRKRRRDAQNWCSWMKPLRRLSGQLGGGHSCLWQPKCKLSRIKGCKWDSEGLKSMFPMGDLGGLGYGCFDQGCECASRYSGLGMLQAQMMASCEQYRFLPPNLAALALYAHALQGHSHDLPMVFAAPHLQAALPQVVTHLAHQMGFLPPQHASSAVPPGLIADGPPAKKMKLGSVAVGSARAEMGFQVGSRQVGTEGNSGEAKG